MRRNAQRIFHLIQLLASGARLDAGGAAIRRAIADPRSVVLADDCKNAFAPKIDAW
jgi:hypothetical protein